MFVRGILSRNVRSLCFYKSQSIITSQPCRCDLLQRITSSSNFPLRRNVSSSEEGKREMAGPTETTPRNRLGNERSPYLLQHASNPVDWYPWGEEAFLRARSEDKLIFLSVGYSTCHWCHVMERESFQDENVASIMNEYFVNIKVDREERPDVDKIYMTFVQASIGSGGWPMNVFLTPDLKPVAGGTYFPPQDSYGRPSFKTLLLNMAKQWVEDRSKVSATGSRITELLRQTTAFDVDLARSLIGGEGLTLGPQIWELCLRQLASSYQSAYGGFSLAPKFPQPSILQLLLHLAARSSDTGTSSSPSPREMALHTLDKMADGGIHDHIGKGFARYSTDEKWLVPHFEKMLYDQAQLTVAYTNAFLLTGKERYGSLARDILTYVTRDLMHPEGGFLSGEDADSYPSGDSLTKAEGAFYTWRWNEVQELLHKHTIQDKSLFNIFAYYYQMEEAGNVPSESDPRSELTGQNILAVRSDGLDGTAAAFGCDPTQLSVGLETGRQLLFEARQSRPRPAVDTKIITAWNGLMISALSRAASAFESEDYRTRAVGTAKFIKKYLYTQRKRLLRSCYSDKEKIVQISKPIEGFLEDYAYLICGLVDLYESSQNPEWLEWAAELQGVQDSLFWDQGLAGYFSTANESHLLLRLKEDSDGAEPSGNSVSAWNLLRLGAILDCEQMKSKAGSLLAAFSSRLNRLPAALPLMVSALILHHDAPTQVVVTGDVSCAETMELVRVVRSRFLPDTLLLTTGRASDSFLLLRNPALGRMHKIGDRESAYVCRGRTCSLPVNSPADLAALLAPLPQQSH